MLDLSRTLFDEVSIDAPWEIVETFSKAPRWKPCDAARSCARIVEQLRSHGVAVEVFSPKFYLSIPFDAEVRTGGTTFRAKPPAYSADTRDGLEAELVHVPAAMSKSISTLFEKSQDAALSAAERISGKIVISEGLSSPGNILEFEQKGAVGVIAVNPGAHWGICTSTWGTPELDDLPRKPGIPVAAVFMPDGKKLIEMAQNGERPHRAGDYAFNNIGLSSLFMLSSTMPDALREEKNYNVVGGCGGNIAWHTEHDLMEMADRDNLVRDIKVYLAAVTGVANAPILPFDWRATAKEFAQTLTRYQRAVGDRFDLSAANDALAALTQALDMFYGSLDGGSADRSKANDAIKRLARILVPINFTRGPRFQHDPAPPILPLPDLALTKALADLDDATLGFAQMQLTRGRNKVVAARGDADRQSRDGLS